jgi:hypothetical protein
MLPSQTAGKPKAEVIALMRRAKSATLAESWLSSSGKRTLGGASEVIIASDST